MSEGQHHPHVHIMFSERLIDDVEKKKERDAKNFFLYPARKKKDGSEPSFEEKWKRGAPKDRKWTDKNFLLTLHADFAQIQNVKYWSETAFPFASITEHYRHKRKRQSKMATLFLPDFLVVSPKKSRRRRAAIGTPQTISRPS